MNFLFNLLFLIVQLVFLFGTWKIMELLVRVVELLTDIRDDRRNRPQVDVKFSD